MKLINWNIQWGRGVDGRVNLDRIVPTPNDSPTSTCCAPRRYRPGINSFPAAMAATNSATDASDHQPMLLELA